MWEQTKRLRDREPKTQAKERDRERCRENTNGSLGFRTRTHQTKQSDNHLSWRVDLEGVRWEGETVLKNKENRLRVKTSWASGLPVQQPTRHSCVAAVNSKPLPLHPFSKP